MPTRTRPERIASKVRSDVKAAGLTAIAGLALWNCFAIWRAAYSLPLQ